MRNPLIVRYPAFAAIRGLCGAFPTVTLGLTTDAAVIVIPDDAPVPPVGSIIDLDVQLDTGRIQVVAFVEARRLVEDDAGVPAFVVDLGLAEVDDRALRVLGDAARLEERLENEGPQAAADELARMRSDAATASGRDEMAAALAPPPPPPSRPAPVRYGYWSPTADRKGPDGAEVRLPRGMRSSRTDADEEPRKRPKPGRHHWDVPDRFRRQ